MVERFIKQGVLTNEQIITAIDNTLIFDDVENIDINTNIKMPTIYPNKTDEEKYYILVDYLNPRDVLHADKVVFLEKALDKLNKA